MLLLLALVGTIFVCPSLETSDGARAGVGEIDMAVVILALRAIGHTPGLRCLGLLLASPPILLHTRGVLLEQIDRAIKKSS